MLSNILIFTNHVNLHTDIEFVYLLGTQLLYRNIGFEVGELGSHPVCNTEHGTKENFGVLQKPMNPSVI
jgi:hypothetical protein